MDVTRQSYYAAIRNLGEDSPQANGAQATFAAVLESKNEYYANSSSAGQFAYFGALAVYPPLSAAESSLAQIDLGRRLNNATQVTSSTRLEPKAAINTYELALSTFGPGSSEVKIASTAIYIAEDNRSDAWHELQGLQLELRAQSSLSNFRNSYLKRADPSMAGAA